VPDRAEADLVDPDRGERGREPDRDGRLPELEVERDERRVPKTEPSITSCGCTKLRSPIVR
jgi:hypothetical protein